MLNKVILLLGSNGEYIFFTIFMLLGMHYEGGLESNIYHIYWIGICIAVVLKIVHLFISDFDKKYQLVLGIIIIISIFTLIFGTSIILYPNNELNESYAIFFLAFAIPAFLVGILCSESQQRINIGKIILLFIPIGTITLIINMTRFLEVQYLESAGGMSRLGAGYMAAQMFSATFCLLVSNNSLTKCIIPKFIKIKYFKIMLFFMLLLQFVVILFSASRGPIIAFILTLFLQILIFGPKKEGLMLFTSFMLLFYLMIFELDVEVFGASIERISTLFISNSEDISNGRSLLYERAIEMFLESPVLGQGPMGFLCNSGYNIYPHNIILEWLVDYGLVGTFFWLLFMGYIINKYVCNFNFDGVARIVFSMFIVNLVELFFSGSFATNGRFWYYIGFAMLLPQVSLNYEEKGEI